MILFVSIETQASKVMITSDGSIIEKSKPTKPIKTILTQGLATIVNYSFKEFACSEDLSNPKTYVLSTQDFGINQIPGEPAIPVRTDLFAIPDGYDVQLEIVNCKSKEYKLNIAPAVMPKPDISNVSQPTAGIIAPYSGLFPSNPVSLKKIEQIRGCRIQYVCVYPVQYNMEQGKTKVIESLSYKISFIPTKSSIPHSQNKLHKSNDTFLTNIVLNPNIIESNNGTNNTRHATQYLIITTSDLLTEVNRFANWKKTFGFDVDVIANEKWTVQSVKQRIEQYYNENDFEYLLLIGDVEQIPYYESGNDVWCGSEIWGNDYFISDYGYSCLDGGELSDVCIGRIPVSNPNEANIIFEKIIRYEKNPCDKPDFYKNAVHASFFEVDSRKSITHECSGFIQCSESIRNLMTDVGLNINRIYTAENYTNPQYMNDSTAIPAELRKPKFNWDGNSADIINAVNDGCVYILHRDHGGVSSWGDPNFTSSDIYKLNNDSQLPIVFSINCLTGRFNANDCFSEHWIKKQTEAHARYCALEEEAPQQQMTYWQMRCSEE